MVKIIDKPFLAWDGEGYTDSSGHHHYMLMRNSKGDEIRGNPLTSKQCLDFIIRTAEKYPKHIHVIYGGGYDVTKWLKDMPFEQQVSLKAEGQTSWACRNDIWDTGELFTMEFIPSKWFILNGTGPETGKRIHCQIFDVVTFFQTSFIKALESRKIHVDPVITSGKAARGNFTYEDADDVSYYCSLELEYLVILCDTLRAEFKEAGLKVHQWHGPGAVANACLTKYGVKEHHEQLTGELEEAANNAYYGGRFEHFYAGHYDSSVYVYDINSAYPHHIRNLPSMSGGQWEYVTEFDPDAWGLWYCVYEPDNVEDDFTSPRPLPWRSEQGDIGFPRRVAGGWYHTPEARLATSVLYGWKFTPATDAKPFAFVEEMYWTRKEWKKEGRGGERALKLAMNSLYGKLAQRVGWNEETNEPPRWHNLYWAGYITSATRAQLWQAISQAPDKIIAVETDSVMSTVPLDLNEGAALGDWEYEKVDWLTYIQSGVYFAGGNGHVLKPAKTKSRGLDASSLDYQEVQAWLAAGCVNVLTVPSHRFIALANPQRELIGEWVDSEKELGLAGGKRLHFPAVCPACESRIPLSEGLHPLEVPPLWGMTESKTNTVPWRKAADGTEDVTGDEMVFAPDAISDWDVPRRSLW